MVSYLWFRFQELAEANGDLRAGYFGPSWEHTEDDTEWMRSRG